MTNRSFVDTDGTDIIDIERRLPLDRVVAALIDSGVLTGEAITQASDYRIFEVTEERAAARAELEREEEARRKAEAEAVKNKTPAEKQAGNEFTADPESTEE